MSGTLLLLLGGGVLVDALRRIMSVSEPESLVMMGVATISLVVNAIVIRMLTRFRKGEVHLRAAWLFTRADIVANIGVILSGVLVLLTRSRLPDIVVGVAIGGYVIREAVEILARARQARAEAAS